MFGFKKSVCMNINKKIIKTTEEFYLDKRLLDKRRILDKI
jgi:hypothetical protein